MVAQEYGRGRADRKPRLETIQVLRGLAAMLVVYNHAALLSLDRVAADGFAFLAPSASIANLGAIGVDLFFAISGFVMALSARAFQGGSGAAEFIALRYIRIAPLFYLFCLVQAVALWRSGLEIDPGTLLNSLLFLPLFDRDEYSWPIHYLGWTLAFEAIFYVVVALLIASRRSRNAGTILLAVVALPLVGLAVGDTRVLWEMVLNPILLEFALGVLAFMLWEANLLRRFRAWLLAGVLAGAGMAFLVAALDLYYFSAGGTVSGSNSLARVLLWGLPAFGLLCLALTLDRLPAGRVGRTLKLVGDASYSIYLSHLFVVAAFGKLLEFQSLPPDLALLATFACSAAAGIAVFHLIEAPMLKVGRNWLQGAARSWLAPRSGSAR